MRRVITGLAIVILVFAPTSCTGTPLPSNSSVSNATAGLQPDTSTPNLELPALPPPTSWVNVSAYTAENQTISVKVGEEFAIGFDTFFRGGSRWEEAYDDKIISLEDSELQTAPAPAFHPAATWFLFKALQTGKTTITFYYYGPVTLRDQKKFNITID